MEVEGDEMEEGEEGSDGEEARQRLKAEKKAAAAERRRREQAAAAAAAAGAPARPGEAESAEGDDFQNVGAAGCGSGCCARMPIIRV